MNKQSIDHQVATYWGNWMNQYLHSTVWTNQKRDSTNAGEMFSWIPMSHRFGEFLCDNFQGLNSEYIVRQPWLWLDHLQILTDWLMPVKIMVSYHHTNCSLHEHDNGLGAIPYRVITLRAWTQETPQWPKFCQVRPVRGIQAGNVGGKVVPGSDGIDIVCYKSAKSGRSPRLILWTKVEIHMMPNTQLSGDRQNP